MTQDLILWFQDLGIDDVAQVGGKNASLGEMIRHLSGAGIAVPDGFATTAAAYRRFIADNRLHNVIADNIALMRRKRLSLATTGKTIRGAILGASLPPAMARAIRESYRQLAHKVGRRRLDVAVRSSATAEDLPEASFAGQQESFLNISGERALLDACRRCLASLFTDRAIAYREAHGFDHGQVALSVGVQQMIRSDKAGAGVMFSIDTDSGFPDAVLINAAWGLGESVVQGTVDPDEYLVYKPLLENKRLKPIIERSIGAKAHKVVYARTKRATTRRLKTAAAERSRAVLSEDEILTLARWAVAVERHYRKPMDMEWAKDGTTGRLWMVQARPETVESRKAAGTVRSYRLTRKGRRLVSGLAIGDAIASGKVCKLKSPAEIDKFTSGAILVTGVTDPDWVPIMKRASAIITDHGGRTSHAAIVSRELGLPAIVGCGTATRVLTHGQKITASCAEGEEGVVYDGIGVIEISEVAIEDIPRTKTQVMLNLGNPAAALRWWRLPSDGVGLARMEFIINNLIKIHPMALVRFDSLKDPDARRRIEQLTRGYKDKTEYFVDALALGIARIAASHYPRPVIVRLSDFKTNEYAALIGGRDFEPHEENPMLGWRGASRYYSDGYRAGFALECRALAKVRGEIGFGNVVVMVPFCRTLAEADRTIEALAANGLKRGKNGLQLYMMCEIPSNVILAARFAERFDGFSIGSNDLTQLTLGVDRDSEMLAELFDESDDAVIAFIGQVIREAHGRGCKVGLCGQAPSDRPEFARLLVEAGIDSISVSPDSFVMVKRHVAEAEARIRHARRPGRRSRS